MKNVLIIIILFNSFKSFSSPKTLDSLCFVFNELNTKIRDGGIEKTIAITQFKNTLSKIKNLLEQASNNISCKEEDYFPLENYSPANIGGKLGNGFVSKGYDYFKGNNHKAHPAQDIFIYDTN